MKELSVEQKAKRYDEALKAAVVAHKDEDRHLKATLERIFPELKESEDEQHRKWILEYLYDGLRKSDEQFKDQFKCAIAWLEKQGEQKHDWSEEDNKMLRFIGNAITADDASIYLKSKGVQIIDAHMWLEELKKRVLPQPEQEWSEEDEKLLNDAISLADDCDDIELRDWLKSLRPKSQWKPSDEQIEYLLTIKTLSPSPLLESLYIDLKKLREE